MFTTHEITWKREETEAYVGFDEDCPPPKRKSA